MSPTPESSFDIEKEAIQFLKDWEEGTVRDGRKNLAERIYNELISDLRDRSGIGDEYDHIDEETKAEFQNTWIGIIVKHLERGL